MSVEGFVVIFRFHCKFPVMPCKFLYMFINLQVFCLNFRHVQVIVLRSELRLHVYKNLLNFQTIIINLQFKNVYLILYI